MHHHRLGRILTVIVSSIAILGSFLAILIFSLHDLGAAKLNADNARYYQGRFYSEDSLLYETGLLRKGDPIGFNEMPTKEQDADGSIYQFIGWDIDNNNIPDVIGDRIYFNFNANALFLRIPIQDFSLNEEQLARLFDLLTNLNLQLTPEQIQQLIDILTGMNIDWTDIDTDLLMRILDFLGLDLEEFMSMLGLDFEGLLGLLNAPVFKYTASDYSMPVNFFRTQSYGSYNGSKWAKGDYYNVNNISEGSVNPLCYTMDKLTNIFRPNQYDITYLKSGKVYPVPNYEYNNTQGLNSESHSLEKPESKPSEEYPKATGYQTTGYGFYPASSYTILMLNKDAPYSNRAIEEDELKYRDYVYSHYLEVDKKYSDYFKQLASENDFERDDYYSFVSKINEYFKSFTLYELNVDEMKSYPKGVDKVMYFMQEAHAGLSEHFATATTLLYRSLGIPARYVEGYFDYVLENTGEERVVGGLQAHSWVEIYVDHIGWMSVDTSISNALPPELSNFLFGAPSVSFDTYEKRTLDHIEVELSKNKYFTGQRFDRSTMTITAHYTNGTNTIIPVANVDKEDDGLSSLTISDPDMSSEGTKTVKVIYIENGVPAVAKVSFEVKDPVVIKLDVDPESYQSVYLPNNKLNMDDIQFKATLDDGSEEKLDGSQVIFAEEIKTDTVGHFEYEVSYALNTEIKAIVPIDVLSEPVAPLKLIKNKAVKEYSVLVNGTFDTSSLLIEATYEDNTYRDVTDETGTFNVVGDFSAIGITKAMLTYVERGVSKTIEINVRVRSIADDVVFNIKQSKIYDGKPFDFANAVTLEDDSGQEMDVLAEDERLEAVFYKTNFTGEEFIDVGSYTFFIKFRIINDFCTVLTEDYMSSATHIKVHPSDNPEATEFEFGNDDFNVDSEGYIDLSGMQFRITPREINVTTPDLTYSKSSGYYTTKDGQMIDSSMLGNFLVVDGLAEDDSFDPSSIIFTATIGDDSEEDNTFDVSSFVITSNSRGVNVTSNYIIKTTWGKLTIID